MLHVPEIDRRNMMLMSGIGLLAAAAMPTAEAHADVPGTGRPTPPLAPPSAGQPANFIFHDEFDGPAGSRPDPSKWNIATHREYIKHPVFWDRMENMGQYRDDRDHVFLDGNGNLVIRATRDGNGRYTSGKVNGTFWGGINTTWEARIKFNCLTLGCWPAWWLSNDHPVVGGEVDLAEWYGNGEWPSGTTVHARSDGTSFATNPYPIDDGWHRWRVTWNDQGMSFWQDYVDGMPPYFEVPANSIDDWPFNLPDYRVFPVLNLAVAGSGGGDPKGGSYPAEMLVDYVRVW
jgi:beta-glucanase (GH16 family)